MSNADQSKDVDVDHSKAAESDKVQDAYTEDLQNQQRKHCKNSTGTVALPF